MVADSDYQDRLSIVIPAFNEEEAVGLTLSAVRAAFPRAEVIVVDDGSTDETAKRAATFADVRLLRHEFNQGYGSALKTGMRAATRPLVAWLDADNEHNPADLAVMVKRLEQERCGAVIGVRTSSGGAVRSFGKWIIRMLARTLGTDLGHDANCGLRVFRRGIILRYANLLPDSFSASLTSSFIMMERGHPIVFHPVSLNPRTGQSKVRLAHGFKTLLTVLRLAMLFAPMRIFFMTGVSLVASTRGEGFPILATLMAILGAQLVMLGLIADQIGQMRISQLGERE